MKVFISWSGDRSKQVAEAFKKYLKCIIQQIDPWLSSADIKSGKRWGPQLADQLKDANFGLVCLTAENLLEPWIHFEAGALSKLEQSYLLTFLLDIPPSQIIGPLSEFQHTTNDRSRIEAMLKEMNSLCESPLPDDVLSLSIDKWWADLEKNLRDIPPANLADCRLFQWRPRQTPANNRSDARLSGRLLSGQDQLCIVNFGLHTFSRRDCFDKIVLIHQLADRGIVLHNLRHDRSHLGLLPGRQIFR